MTRARVLSAAPIAERDDEEGDAEEEKEAAVEDEDDDDEEEEEEEEEGEEEEEEEEVEEEEAFEFAAFSLLRSSPLTPPPPAPPPPAPLSPPHFSLCLLMVRLTFPCVVLITELQSPHVHVHGWLWRGTLLEDEEVSWADPPVTGDTGRIDPRRPINGESLTRR
jgi:hypothetical protein